MAPDEITGPAPTSDAPAGRTPRKRAPRRATTTAQAPVPAAEREADHTAAQAPETHDVLGTPDAAAHGGDVAMAAEAAETLDAAVGDAAREAGGDEPVAPAKKTAKKAAKSAKKATKRPSKKAAEPSEPAVSSETSEDVAPRRSRGRKRAVEPATVPGAVEPIDAADVAAAAVSIEQGEELPIPLSDAIALVTATDEMDDEAMPAVTVVSADEILASLQDAIDVAEQERGGDDTVTGLAGDPAAGRDDEDDEDDDDRLTVPSFGLLFQAPDPAKARRSRRASSPATTPVTREERDEAADLDADLDADASSEDGTDTRAREVHEDGEERSGRGRGRGRGRRRGRSDDRAESGQDAGTTDEQDDETASHDDESDDEPTPRRRRSRGGRGRKRASDHSGSEQGEDADDSTADPDADDESGDEGSSSRRRRRRRRAGSGGDVDDAPGVVTKVREPRRSSEATGIKGSTRLEAKKQRRREGREAGRRRTIITEAEFLARRESVKRSMVVRVKDGRTQIAVLEDGVLVEHYVSQETSQVSTSIAGNIFLGRVQNVLPSMEAAFVDIGRGRNAVLYAGEVNWDAAGLENGQARRIENALKSGETVLVQATKDPIGHKGARLTSQISLPGRYLVFVPNGSMTGISRKLPDTERSRLKKILREVMPENAGVIVRTAAEGASEEELRADVARLTALWDDIQAKAKARSTHAPALLHGEPDLTVRVIRDVFNEDFSSLVVSGDEAWGSIKPYIDSVAPDLADRVTQWTEDGDVFAKHRIDEQLAKAMDRKVYLPSGGSLVIDRTEAMTVVDVNTGKFTGAGGNLEETVTKNNLEAAEEVVRQLRLRDIGGIIVVDFIDMVLESNRELVLRRLVECLGRDRTKHQVAEVTSLGLVQMTRKRVGTGLVEAFSEICTCCNGRGLIIHDTPVGTGHIEEAPDKPSRRSRRGRGGNGTGSEARQDAAPETEDVAPSGPTPAQIAAAAHAAAQAAAQRTEQVADEGPASDAEVAAAIEEAVSAVLGEARTDPAPHTSVPADALSDAEHEADDELVVAPAVPIPAEKPARRSRRRGRVVAPAGPPRAAQDDEAAPSAGADRAADGAAIGDTEVEHVVEAVVPDEVVDAPADPAVASETPGTQEAGDIGELPPLAPEARATHEQQHVQPEPTDEAPVSEPSGHAMGDTQVQGAVSASEPDEVVEHQEADPAVAEETPGTQEAGDIGTTPGAQPHGGAAAEATQASQPQGSESDAATGPGTPLSEG